MQSSSTFISISGPIQEVKKKAYDYQWLWKYYCLFRRVQAKWVVGEQVWFLRNTLGRSEGQCQLKKIWQLLLSFSFGNSISSILIDTKLIYKSKYEPTLFLKTGNLILNWVPLSFFWKHPMPERPSWQSISPIF